MEAEITARFYKSCLLIRRVEEEIERLYPSDKIKSPVHLSIGQESVAVATCSAITTEDIVFSNYRGHAAYIAKGGDLKAMWAELFGKKTGFASGKAGSMHLIDKSVGFMGTSAIVATAIPNAVGYAWALKEQGKNNLVVNFFGDGATDEGVFHESMNFAALKAVPIIFICENNGFAIYSDISSRSSTTRMVDRAKVYGMPTIRIENGDIFALYDAVKKASVDIKNGKSGPIFIEVMTCRWRDHVGPGSDNHIGYRSTETLEEWQENDQILKLASLLDPALKEKIETEVEEKIAEAIKFAEHSEFPNDNALMENVFHHG